MPRAYNKVMLRGSFEQYEALAIGICSPGHLLMLDSAGKVKVHNGAGDYAQMIFAIEDSLQGNDIDDAYAVGDLVQYVAPVKGSIVYVRIKNGENIAIGDQLVSNADGTFKEDTGTDKVLGIALDACDLSSSSSVDPSPWTRMRIL